jgi:hypothetical protein
MWPRNELSSLAEVSLFWEEKFYFLRTTDFKLLGRIKVTKRLRLFKVCNFCYGWPFCLLAPGANKPSYVTACRVMSPCDHCLTDCNKGYATTSFFCFSESWFSNVFRVQDWGLKNLQTHFIRMYLQITYNCTALLNIILLFVTTFTITRSLTYSSYLKCNALTNSLSSMLTASPPHHPLWSRQTNSTGCRSRWSCFLRRRSAAAWLLGSWVRIPLRACLFFCCFFFVCCVGRVLCDGADFLVQRIPTVCVFDWVWSRNLKDVVAKSRLGLLHHRRRRQEQKDWMNLGMRLHKLTSVQFSPTSGYFIPRKTGLPPAGSRTVLFAEHSQIAYL